MSAARCTLIVGCGDTGLRVAARALAVGDRVFGLVRGAASAARVRSVGAMAIRADLDAPVAPLPRCDRLIYSAPPPGAGLDDTRMAHGLDALPAPPAALVYISTSGVYGDCGGAWVDETRAAAPVSARAKRRLAAERRIRDYAPHATVLRAPGIYGPGRLPVGRVLTGEPVLDDSTGAWSNRVHVDDLAAMAWAAVTTPWPDPVYNACDGQPLRPSVYYDTLAEMLGVAPPPRIGWAEAQRRFSPQRLSFVRESRRLCHRRLISEPPGFRLYYGDYRQGLAASLQGYCRAAGCSA